jgi:DNA-binding CsgD family transcriptional regulator
VALDFARGRWDGIAERARAFESEEGHGGQTLVARLVRGVHALAEGRKDAAGDELADVLEIAEREGAWSEMAYAAGGLARIRLDGSEPAGALEVASRALDILCSKGIWAWCTEVVGPTVEALLALGREDDAAALVKEMAGGLKGYDAPAAKAALGGCRAMVALAQGNEAAASRTFADAERMWRALPNPYHAARLLETRSTALHGSKVELAHKLQLRALEEYEALGAAGEAARLRGRLRAQGVAFGHRRGRRGYGDELSPREREIAAFVALGHTNREIAERLYLSVRTVDAHVARVLRKVGARTRRDLVTTKD